MTAPVAARWDTATDDVLAEHRHVHMVVHRPLQALSLVPGCGTGKPMHRFGRWVVAMEIGEFCTRTGCWPKGPER